MSKDYAAVQQAELDSWFSDDPAIEQDKRLREIIRYPQLLKQMGLTYLDTSDMTVWDIGAGPYNGVSTLIRAKLIQRFDPLADEYRKHYPLYNYHNKKAEDLDLSIPDLIIITNALDHFENPEYFLKKLKEEAKPGVYFAHIHAIDNAYSHEHEAHAWNVNPELLYQWLGKDFELVWNLDYQHDRLTYGWRHQPAFAQLWRKSKYA